jgi:hypothetical protein
MLTQRPKWEKPQIWREKPLVGIWVRFLHQAIDNHLLGICSLHCVQCWGDNCDRQVHLLKLTLCWVLREAEERERLTK